MTIFASYKGRSLLRISPKQTALEIQEFFDELESVRVSKHWPRGMEVNVVFRRPVLRLCLGELPEKSEDSFIPPSEANCQSYSLQASELLDEDRQLPRFFAASRPLLLIKELVELSSYLQKANILIGDGWVPRQEHSVVIFVGGRKIVFSLEKDLVNQVDSLQAILSRSTMMDKPVSQVDFRFEKPVVRFVE